MLGDRNAIATVAVKDLDAARRFYTDTLGLTAENEMPGEAITFRTGSTAFLVYRSEFAGTNQSTAVNWWVGDDLESVVEGLRKKGVAFEHYDIPGAAQQGDIHVIGPMKAAWFKDPDGNIHSVMNA
jgi:catechol 2,3-dioxygenase-like lactoylglutathione lyase family enzyme